MAEPIVIKKVTDQRLTDPEHLAKFVGTYEMASKQRGELTMLGTVLRFAIRGHSVDIFQPSLNDHFLLKEVPEVGVGFEFSKHAKVVKIRSFSGMALLMLG